METNNIWIIVDLNLEILAVATNEKCCCRRLKNLQPLDCFVQVFKWNGFGFGFLRQIRDPQITADNRIVARK